MLRCPARSADITTTEQTPDHAIVLTAAIIHYTCLLAQALAEHMIAITTYTFYSPQALATHVIAIPIRNFDNLCTSAVQVSYTMWNSRSIGVGGLASLIAPPNSVPDFGDTLSYEYAGSPRILHVVCW